MDFGNGTNRPGVLKGLVRYALHGMRSDVRGVVALLLLIGSVAMALALPRVGVILLSLLFGFLAVLMLRANFRHSH